MKRIPIVVFACLLLSVGGAFGADQPSHEELAGGDAEPAEAQTIFEVVTEDGGECRLAEPDGEGEKVFTGGFGPHCSTPFTCTYQEPGLGFGCTCTYECDCAYCNGQLTRINCELIDDGGCFSCPS